MRDTIIVDIAGITSDSLIASGTERLVSLAGNNDYAYLRILTSILKDASHLEDRPGSKGVALLRTINSDLGDTFSLVVPDIIVSPGIFPFYHSHR
jgi:hypothetical protein